MFIEDKRPEFELMIKNPAMRILIVIGPAGSDADVAYDSLKQVDWGNGAEYIWIQDGLFLTSEERDQWFGVAAASPKGCFVGLQGGPDPAVISNGRTQHLFMPGTPNVDASYIQLLFSGNPIPVPGL